MADPPSWYHPVRARPFPDLDEEPVWARHPKTYQHAPGVYFFIGQLSEALDRSPGTMRRWESKGWLPPSPYVDDGIYDLDGSEDHRGRRRLYTAAHIATAERIADEEGLLGTRRCCPGATAFPERVSTEWDRLSRLHPIEEPLDVESETRHRPTPWSELIAQQPTRQHWLLPPAPDPSPTGSTYR